MKIKLPKIPNLVSVVPAKEQELSFDKVFFRIILIIGLRRIKREKTAE